MYDSRNARLQILDKNGEEVHTIALNYRGSMAVTEHVLLVPNMAEVGHFVAVHYSAAPPFNRTGNFMPRLVALNEQKERNDRCPHPQRIEL